jgi:hypothetical protein
MSIMTDQLKVDITGLSKASVLAALFNASAPSGMGFLQAQYGPQVMTVGDAEQVISDRPKLYFDFLFGRPLKTNLEDDFFDPRGFDDKNGGTGLAEKVISRLRESGEVNPPESQEANATTTALNAHSAMEYANTPSTWEGDTLMLGGDDVGAVLQHAVDAELRRRES